MNAFTSEEKLSESEAVELTAPVAKPTEAPGTWPCFSDTEAKIVSDVLKSNKVNYWTGTECVEFEKEFASYFEAGYSIAMANGTVVLEAALRALGIGAGDEVIVTTRSFVASASCVLSAGAIPVFADVDVDSQNITAQTIEPLISDKTKAIICVHLAGWPCEMNEIQALAATKNIAVIEDCAQAHGATYRGKPVGNFSEVGCWSFCQDKIMTTGGEGGMITTSDGELWSAMWSLKDHGKSPDLKYGPKVVGGGFRWVHGQYGTNWRLTEMQAALGRYQLTQLSEWSEARQRNAKSIWSRAEQTPGIRVPQIPDYVTHAAYRCTLFVETQSLKEGWSRDRILSEMQGLGLLLNQGSCPEIQLEKMFDSVRSRSSSDFAVAKKLGESSLSIQVHPTLSSEYINYFSDCLEHVMSQAVL